MNVETVEMFCLNMPIIICMVKIEERTLFLFYLNFIFLLNMFSLTKYSNILCSYGKIHFNSKILKFILQ